MKVVVDTCVWSLALRRQTKTNDSTVNKLRDLIADGRVILLGAVRQEIISGIKYQEQFEKLRDHLRAFPNLSLNAEDYELAADYFNANLLH
jgi:predicted nucleic acid-binding protein